MEPMSTAQQKQTNCRIQFLDCPVDNLTMKEAVSKIEKFISSKGCHQIVPINAAKLWRMERDEKLAQIVRGADLIIAEKAILLGARILGTPLKDHIGGIMLLKAFLPHAEARGYRLYFLGAKPLIVREMMKQLKRQYPQLNIVGSHHGYFPEQDNARVVNSIRASQPDVLFVAMGTPKQEYWINEHLDTLEVPVCMGLGGSFDVLAGMKRDAPHWIRSLYLEWLYRLLQDPRKWKRYLITNPWFLRRVLQAKKGLKND